MEMNKKHGIRHAKDIEVSLNQEYRNANAHSVFLGLPVSLNKEQVYKGPFDFKAVAQYVSILRAKTVENSS